MSFRYFFIGKFPWPATLPKLDPPLWQEPRQIDAPSACLECVFRYFAVSGRVEIAGICNDLSFDLRPELTSELPGFVGMARSKPHLMPGLGPKPSDRRADLACADEPDLHAVLSVG